ncbi:MAG TPA: glycoside hydrolase family 25 protein [Candidatus Limnocylindria bacterium]|nr:glycoside hydrolase family 25 protein [Candidatus Limnocylindria bacterium]
MLASLGVLATPVQAASGTYVANCDARLRASASTGASVIDVVSAGASVTVSGQVSGSSWSATCGGSDVSGSNWHVITAVGGKSTSSLYGKASVYAADGLFSVATSPPAGSGGYLNGIDVSKWQGTIDWAKVRSAGYRFAIVKATEGVGYTDPKWTTNRSGARAAGLMVGAYHFARPDANTTLTQARQEAAWFASQIGPMNGMVVPALDLEVRGSQTAAELVAWTKAWLGEFYARTGVKAMIYTSPSFWRTYLGDSRWFADNGYKTLWVAHWTPASSPSVPASNWGGRGWTFWQYTSDGTVPGISGRVDLNRYNGSDLTPVIVGADFSLGLAAGFTTDEGGDVAGSVSIQRSWFTLPVSLAVSGLPAGFTATLGATSTKANSTTLDISAASSVAPGDYAFTVTGTANGLKRTASGTVTVVDGEPPVVVAPRSYLSGSGQLIASSIAVRTTWSASDPAGVGLYATERQSNGGSWMDKGLATPTTTSLTERLTFGSTFRYRTRATDTFDNTSNFAAGPTLKAVRTQQYAKSIKYSSGWTGVYKSKASGGSLRYAKRAGAWASYTFTGRSVAWVAYKGPNRGRADVYIDGVKRGTINTYATTYQARAVVFAANWAKSGKHTIRIVVKGTAGHPRVDLDLFVRLISG